MTLQLAAIMKKTGTKQDVDQYHSRKDQVRARLSKQASIGPLLFGPTALIVCPTSLVDNVRLQLLYLMLKLLLTRDLRRLFSGLESWKP
jgi:hypothetical protein